MTWRWEARAKHWADWREIAKSLGFLDSNGNVRLWKGPEFWKLFGPRGHDSADFDSCSCGHGLPEQPIGNANLG